MPKETILTMKYLSLLASAITFFGVSADLTCSKVTLAKVAFQNADEVEVLTRGPVHEAFAETVTFDPQPGLIVDAVPPEPIEELPPDQQPEGANVNWIPGYFAWDDDRGDFLWVSGIWRDLPPGREWVPGYWMEVEGGAQWISGYWADASLTEMQYLPEPPATVEAGPNIAAPGDDYLWTPGCWVWHQNRYAWRPGYWVQVQQNWDWIPAHYVWSPRGYVFVNGYYDHSVGNRGVLFAPVYVNSNVYSRRGYVYSPLVAVNLGLFTAHLFSRPNYGHYYFGDYYASSYQSNGYYPWFNYASSGYGYDPFYARQRWTNRQTNNWQQQLETDYNRRRDNESDRPPRTLSAQVERNRDASDADQKLAMALPLDQLAKQSDSPQKFRTVNKDERQRISDRSGEIRKFRLERQKLETTGVQQSGEVTDGGAVTNPDKEKNPPGTKEPVKIKSPRSPIAAAESGESANQSKVPKAPESPELDLQAEAKPRPSRKLNPRTPPSADQGDTKKPSAQAAEKTKNPGKNNSAPGAKATPKDSKPNPDDQPKEKSRGERPGKAPMPNPPEKNPAKGPRNSPESTPPKQDPGGKKPKSDPPSNPKVNPPDRPVTPPTAAPPKANPPKRNDPKKPAEDRKPKNPKGQQ